MAARSDFPYGNETAVTSGLNAVMDVLEGGSASFPYGSETMLTAGFNAVLSRLADFTYTLTEQDKADIAAQVEYTLTAQDKADIAALVEADYANGDAAAY